MFVNSKLNVAYKLNQWNFNLNMTPRPANATPNQLYTMSFNTRLLNPCLGVDPARQFGRAKLAQMMYIRHLALRMRDSNLAAIAVCPGKNLHLYRSRQFQEKVLSPDFGSKAIDQPGNSNLASIWSTFEAKSVKKVLARTTF